MDILERVSDSVIAEINACDAREAFDACDARFVRLADGACVRLRAVSADDRDDAALRRLFFTLSDTARYLYFFAGVPSNATWAERFVALGHPDGIRSYVLVAEVDGDLVGFASFRQDSHAGPHERSADLGIVLADVWQGRGLGGHMLTCLAGEALRRDVTTLTAEVLFENRRMLRLARRIFPERRMAYASGSYTLTIDLDTWQTHPEYPK